MKDVSIGRMLSRLAGSAARRPLPTLALALALGVVGAVCAIALRPSAAADTFVGRSSGAYRATQSFYRSFGEEPIGIVVQGNLQQLLLSSDLERLVGLEGCLSGNVPAAGLAREGGTSGPCGQLGRLHTVKVVVGPGTFLNEAAEQIDHELSVRGESAERRARQASTAVYRAAIARGLSAAEAHSLATEASKLTLERYAQEVELLGVEYGLSSPPSIGDPSFVSRVVFDNTAKVPGTPKQRFAYLFPSRDIALIAVRMRAGLSEAQRSRTIALVKRAVAMPQWHLQHGGRYLITGEPVVVAEMTASIARSVELLLVAVALAMALALGLVFRGRPRLLPLAIAALATALTFGGLYAVGASLSVAQIAVLPVLVGLAVDYAIQFQSRVAELRDEGLPAEEAVVRAAARAGPTIAVAAAAGGAALLVLELSPVPTVRGFGLLLVAGIAVAFVCALCVVSAVFVLGSQGDGVPVFGPRRARARGHEPTPARMRTHARARAGARRGLLRKPHTSRLLGSLAAPLVSSWRGARELLRDNPATGLLSRAALVHAVSRPGRVLGVGLVLAALGWGLDTQTHVETNLEKLVPQSMSSLHNLTTLERASGVGGEIDLMVSGRDVTKPATIEWMSSYESSVLRRFGYSVSRGCGKALLCPAFSLPDLFAGGALGGASQGASQGGASQGANAHATPKLSKAEITGLLAAIPTYFSQDVLTPDRHVATLAFGIRLMGLDRQQRVIEAMRASLHPPRGVAVQLVGLPVLAAQSGAAVASPWRRVLTLLAGLAVAALVLLAAFRGDRRRAFAPLLPVVLATGWSALVVFAIRVPLNPMSVTLSALVIAISTEFSVLLAERTRQERLAGHPLGEALRLAYTNTGAAVAASGVTAIVGFGVLVLSDIAMLRDFGIVTVIDLSVSLIGVLIALPAALVLAEPGELARRLPRRAGLRLRARASLP